MDQALTLEKEGKFDEAVVIYRQVAAEMPEYADVYARMAYTLQKMEYAKQSDEMLQKCIKLGGIKEDSPYAMNVHLSGGIMLTDSMFTAPPKEEKELTAKEIPSKALACGTSEYWLLMMTRPDDGVAIVDNFSMIGVGSEIRFDRGDWVTFLGRQYRKGGFRVLKSGVEFLEGTEQMENGGITVYEAGKWINE
jgi:tetratricopeptide (TPR) repeat protein